MYSVASSRVIAVIAIAMLPSVAAGLQASLTDDSYTVIGKTTIYGAKNVIKVKDGEAIGWMRFDLAALPAGTTAAGIGKATLRVYVQKIKSAGTVDVFEAGGAWTEGALTDPGPAFGSSVQTGVPIGTKNDYVEIDVTAAVQAWVTTPANNFGLVLVPAGGLDATLDSKESKSTSQPPTLDIALAAGSVTSSQIVDGTIVNADIANNTITGAKILDGTITGADIADGAITGTKIANSTITGSKISAGSIGSINIQDGAITGIKIQDNTIDSDDIQDHSITGADIQDHSITSADVADGSLKNHDIDFSTAAGTNNLAIGWLALDVTTGSFNTAVGLGALRYNTTADYNTAVGAAALGENTTACCSTAIGTLALTANTTGAENTAVGNFALAFNTSGGGNTAVGSSSLSLNTTGINNVAVGLSALVDNSTGFSNVAVGGGAMGNNTNGFSNVAIGSAAMANNTTGDVNVAIGNGAGLNWTTGNANIAISNSGVAGESNTIRIGGSQSATYIAGIHGATSTSGIGVFVNSSGRLGTTTSSRRFKTDIHGIGDTSAQLLQLRPVSFRYNQDIDPDGIRQYGLIAEEVAEVFPDLVVNGEDGKPYTVKYHLLAALLLNELQLQHARVESVRLENARLRAQVQQISGLQARLEAIEAALSDRGEMPLREATLRRR